METQQDTEFMRAYMHTVTSSRVTMNNMLNIFAQQDRNMQSIILVSRHQNTVIRNIHNVPTTHFASRFANQRNHRSDNHPRSEDRARSENQPRSEIHHRRSAGGPQNSDHSVGHNGHPMPFSVRPSVSLPHNVQVNRPIYPPWLNTALNNFDNLAPVVVRPTPSQIDNAAEEVRFGIVTNPVNSVCPITRERFSDDDRVIQIVHCGHNFHPESLRHWFQTNVRCPLCRYDIRDYNPRDAIYNPFQGRTSMTRNEAPNNGTQERLAADVPGSPSQSRRDETRRRRLRPWPPPTTPPGIRPHTERILPINIPDSRENIVSQISAYISRDIIAQLDDIPIDSSGNILLEYSFRNPLLQQTGPDNNTVRYTLEPTGQNIDGSGNMND